MKNFIGQKLKCVDDSPPTFVGVEPLKKDEIYVVEEIINEQDLRVEGNEYGWNKNRFIPVSKDTIMENEPTEEQRKQSKDDLQALERLGTKFVTNVLTDLVEKGKCEMSAEVTVKVTVKLTKPKADEEKA